LRTSVAAVFTFQNVEKICAVDIVAPDPTKVDVSPFMFCSPSPGTATDALTLEFTFTDVTALPVASAGNIVTRVRTTRGIRMVDFKTPPMPEYKPNGALLNVHSVINIGCFGGLPLRP
jgi:hypothetical protein